MLRVPPFAFPAPADNMVAMPSVDTPRDPARATPAPAREAIGEIAAGVAHEFRNPLLGISSAAQLLRFRAREDPVVEKNVGRILREVERLNRLVASLLDYGRPNPLQPELADPDDIWDEVIEGNRGLLESRALHLERARATPGTRIPLDREQLAQAFREILVNAIDAAPEASDLTLTSTRLDDGGWRCTLMNGGAPLAAEILARAFDVFFSTKPGGTGMGLPLCQRIIQDHRGTVALDSAADRGTNCTVVLPPAAHA
jgi:signal transduction histidine kinase